MTALLEPARCLPSRDAAAALGVHRDTAVKKFRELLWHAHNADEGQRFGAWWMCPTVARRVREAREAGRALSIPQQKRSCAMCRSGATPPHVRGGARRSRHPRSWGATPLPPGAPTAPPSSLTLDGGANPRTSYSENGDS